MWWRRRGAGSLQNTEGSHPFQGPMRWGWPILPELIQFNQPQLLVYVFTKHLYRSLSGAIELLADRSVFFFRLSVWYIALIVSKRPFHKFFGLENISITSFFKGLSWIKERLNTDWQSCGDTGLFLCLPNWGSYCSEVEPCLVLKGSDWSAFWLVNVELVISSSDAAKLRSENLVRDYRIVIAVAWSSIKFKDSQIPGAMLLKTAKWITEHLVA